jgi:hypothetical protein
MRILSWLTGALVAGFCLFITLHLLLADPPRYGRFVCLLPFLAGIVVGAYFGNRAARNLEDPADAGRVYLLGAFAPRSAFTTAGRRFRTYAGVAVLAGWLASGLLMAFYGF